MGKKAFVVSLLLWLVILAGCGPGRQAQPATLPPGATGTGTPTSIPGFSHIFVIMMENKEYSTVMGSSAAPYINSLAHQYGVAANYYGITHPSLPNYLELLGGSTFGIKTDCSPHPASCHVNAPNLVDQLERAHKSWRAYMEDMPGPCFVGNAYPYAARHNPFIYFDDIRNDPARCANIVPLTNFAHDLATDNLPDFVWITPNLCHDMHDCGVSAGDTWLQNFLPQILHTAFRRPQIAIFLVWDEGSTSAGCCQIASGGHVPMLVISPLGKQGFTSSVNYTHASLLLTIERAWNLGTLNDTDCACTAPMSDFFA